MDDDEKLADAHVRWYIDLLKSQWLAWIEITENLMRENFIHGIKHGRELERKKRGQVGPESGAEPGPDLPFLENGENEDLQ